MIGVVLFTVKPCKFSTAQFARKKRTPALYRAF